MGRIHKSKVDFFAEIVFGCRLFTFFVKSCKLDVWLIPEDASKKDFLCFVRDDFASLKTRNSYTHMLTFRKKMWLIKMGSARQKGELQ